MKPKFPTVVSTFVFFITFAVQANRLDPELEKDLGQKYWNPHITLQTGPNRLVSNAEEAEREIRKLRNKISHGNESEWLQEIPESERDRVKRDWIAQLGSVLHAFEQREAASPAVVAWDGSKKTLPGSTSDTLDESDAFGPAEKAQRAM